MRADPGPLTEDDRAELRARYAGTNTMLSTEPRHGAAIAVADARRLLAALERYHHAEGTTPVTIDDADPLFTPAEVAAIFRVDPKTVTRWANDGRLPFILTPGGHHRFHTSAVNKVLGLEEDR